MLDDYHLIETPAIHQELTYFLDHLPAQVHLFITTRSAPPIPLDHYRGYDQLVELRTADLRFMTPETAAFLNETMKLNLDSQAVNVLEERAEGWITGLQMAALTLQRRPRGHVADFLADFSGSHRYVLDYLTDEVLDNQAQEIQEFLLHTALLERLFAPLCDAVREREGSQAVLEQIEASNLFLFPLDEERKWFRYHHLFADFLRQRLKQHAPKQVRPCHLRASTWYEAAGLPQEAIEHALAAGASLAAQ